MRELGYIPTLGGSRPQANAASPQFGNLMRQFLLLGQLNDQMRNSSRSHAAIMQKIKLTAALRRLA